MTTPLRLLLGRALLAGAALASPLPLWAQAPAGCSSTYTTTGTAPGSTAGLFTEYYAGPFHTQSGFNENNPNTFFSANTPGQTAVSATVNFRNFTGSDYGLWPVTRPPAGGSASEPTNFSARVRGSVYLEAGAPYTFYLNSDDASYLFLNRDATLATPTPASAFVNNGGSHGDQERTGTFTAPATGLYDLQILYGQGGGGSNLRLDYAGGPGNLPRQRVPQTALCAGPSGRDYSVNSAPTANNATNSGAVFADGGDYTLTPNLSATDLDGSIASYTITSVPSQGTLSYNVNASGTPNYVPVTVPLTIPASATGRLRYTTPSGGAGYTTSFQFQATDNSGAVSSNTATYTIPVQALTVIDLTTTLAAPATAPQGSLVYYTATARNNGPSSAPNTVITIFLPTGLTGISLSNSGTYNSTTGRATFPSVTLGAGGTATRSIAFTMPAQPVNGSASAATSSAGYVDSTPSNDVGTAYTAPTQVADVAVAINGPTRVVTNQTITYTVVTTNQGPSTATSVTPRAQLATGLMGVVVSNGGSYNTTNGQVTWPAVGTLAVGDYLAYTVRFNAPATAGGTVSGAGAATSATANGDPAAGNNDGTNGQAQITTQIIGTTAAATECVDPETPDPGFQATPNTYYPGVGTASAGSTTLTVGAVLSAGNQTPLAAGDLLVVMQMQGAELNATNTDAYGDGIDNNGTGAGNLQNATFRAGLYEYGVVQSVSGSTVTLRTALINDYVSADATGSQGQQRFQVIRVPRNGPLTLTGTVTGPRWNGRTGGVVVLDVNGTLNFNGRTIDMAGRGFRGGAGQQFGGNNTITDTNYRHSNTLSTSANKGEGVAGTPRYLHDADNFAAYRAGTAPTPFLDTQASGLLPAGLTDGYPNGDRGRGAPGNAGGGGTDGNPASNDQNTGGGGGGNAGRGGRGGNAWDSNDPTGGFGGADFTQATPSRLIMGGGGGAGTTNNGTIAGGYAANTGIPAAGSTSSTGVPMGGFTSSGAAGGGIVLLRANNLTGAGTIDVSGADMPYVAANDASGGGGAGGSVLLLVNASNGNPSSPVLQNITVLANGGRGGSNTGGGAPHGPGGGGAGGVVFASSQLNAATSSVPGINGTTFGFESYGSGVAGADLGQAQSGITRADVPNQIGSCPADVVTTLTASATTLAPGNSVTLTLTATNAGPGLARNVVPTLTLTPNLPAGAFSSLGGGTYDASTGVVTFPTSAQLANGAMLTYAVMFSMPSQTVLAQAASSADDDLDPRTANNDGTLTAARVRVEPVFDIAGRIFDDVNYGGGRGRDYATAEAQAQASGVSASSDGSATGSKRTRVELYNNSGVLVAATESGADGLYGFSGIVSSAGTSYTVRVVNSTVRSARSESASGVVAVQTFRVNNGAPDLERVGGEAPEKVDAPANSGTATLSELTQAGSAPQSVATVTFGSSAQVTGVDFGFNFSTVVNTRDAGQGSLRQFILNSNALPNLQLDQAAASSGGANPPAGTETSIFMIADGQAREGLRAGLVNQLSASGVASIVLNTAASGGLPAITDNFTALDGTTQTQNVGNTNAATLGAGGTVGGSAAAATALSQVSGPEVQLVGTPGQANSEYGLTLSAGSLSVTGLAVYGFGNTAGSTTGANIYVTGNALTGTVISGNVLGATATAFQAPSGASPGSGIYLAGFSSAALGSVAASITGNLIGFHGGSGIENLASGSPTTLLIQNNEIRGNATANSAADGVRMGNYGGTVRGNLVVANRGIGLDLQGTTGSVTVAGNTVQGNGTGGVATAGIRLGGTASTVSQNVVSNNQGAGVLALASSNVNQITQNSTLGNGTLGIDLLSSADNADGGTSPYVTRNDNGDADTGANGLINFPVITQAVTTGGNLVLTGYAPTGAVLEFFLPDPNAQGFGQGQTYLFSRTEGTGGNDSNTDRDANRGGYSGLISGVDQGTESNASRFLFRIPLSSFTAAQQTLLNSGTARLTATATVAVSANRSTSEFSGNILVLGNTPLPVTLASFTAQAAGFDGRLNWRTAQEQNNAYFAVERSWDGRTFEELGRVAGAGTTTQPRLYAFTDAGVGRQAAGRAVYYRLRQVDTDGSRAFSNVEIVRFGAPAAAVTVYPTPSAGAATLDLAGLPQGPYQVRVLDAVGRVVYAAPGQGAATQPLPAHQWPQGTYIVQVSGAAGTRTVRFVRE